jgi:hypothetical protein
MPDERIAGDLEALATQVRQARQTAGISIDAAADSAGMSPVTWGRVEKALPVRALSYAGVEKVLGWAPGSVAAILAGGEPAPVARHTDLAEIAIRKIEEVLDFRGLTASMRVDTIRGIVAHYRQDVARSVEAARSEEPPEQRLAAG